MKIKLTDGEIVLPDNKRKAARYLADIFYNSGYVEDEDAYIPWSDMYSQISPKMKDATSSSDVKELMQSSMEILIREPIEPLMVITGLYDRVQSKGMNVQVLAGAMGAVTAGDIAEHGTYPEVMFQIGGGMQTAYVGKSGIAASFTDEVLRYSTWDIMALNARQMGNALLRHKEQKAVSFLRKLGVELFNNLTPSTSLFGVTTGRDLGMTANGSLVMDDVFKGMAHMAEEGFHPNIMLVNPLFFYQFIQDPLMRDMMSSHGGGSYFTPWNGQPGPLDTWSNGSIGGRGPSLGNKISRGAQSPGGSGPATGIAGREHGMTAQFPVPSYFPWEFKVMVSPFVPFDPNTMLGDVYLLSGGNVGYYLVDEDPVTVEWRDENVDVVKMKIRERYGFNVKHEGQGVGVIKNVKLARNYWDGIVRATTDSVSEISADASIDL